MPRLPADRTALSRGTRVLKWLAITALKSRNLGHVFPVFSLIVAIFAAIFTVSILDGIMDDLRNETLIFEKIFLDK